jgi:hypothetical protein
MCTEIKHKQNCTSGSSYLHGYGIACTKCNKLCKCEEIRELKQISETLVKELEIAIEINKITNDIKNNCMEKQHTKQEESGESFKIDTHNPETTPDTKPKTPNISNETIRDIDNWLLNNNGYQNDDRDIIIGALCEYKESLEKTPEKELEKILRKEMHNYIFNETIAESRYNEIDCDYDDQEVRIVLQNPLDKRITLQFMIQNYQKENN